MSYPEVWDADILRAIVAAHRAIACEEAAVKEPCRADLWNRVAAGEHRIKRAALVKFEVRLASPYQRGH